MKYAILILALSISAFGQKTNDAIQKQIKSLKADKQITLSYDRGGNASKIMATAENFADKDAKAAGVQAMNFGMAFFYVGQSLAASPEYINFTFWVLTKKPQFANGSRWIVTLPSGDIDLGDSRYVGKPGESMEYLNFKIKRDDLAKIAAASNVKFKLGQKQFTFTPGHIQMFKSLIAVSQP